MNAKNIGSVFVLFWLMATTLFAQDPARSNTNNPQTNPASVEKLTAKDYEKLAAKLKDGDTDIDFRRLRMAYTETSDFSPYAGGDVRKKMNEALDKKEYRNALKHAEERLKTTYVDIDAHLTASIANRELGKTKEAGFHGKVVGFLVGSILSDGDGLTAKTAYWVISTREEYLIMNFKGYRVVSQALANEGGHIYDILTGTKPGTDQTVKFYFNIDKVFGKF